MNVKQLQLRLQQANCDPGAVDGELGPKTFAALFRYAANTKIGPVAADLGKGAAAHFADFGITTPLRIAHFIGQGHHETCGFLFFVEKGGTAYLSMYDPGTSKGKRLGNTQPGDGPRFRGRGIFQCTGRANYARYGEKCGIDLLGHPEKAAEPDTSVLIACHYWRDNDLNALADQDNCPAITKRINGGFNGLEGRQRATDRLKAILL